MKKQRTVEELDRIFINVYTALIVGLSLVLAWQAVAGYYQRGHLSDLIIFGAAAAALPLTIGAQRRRMPAMLTEAREQATRPRPHRSRGRRRS